MKKHRRRNAPLDRLGEEPAKITPAEELREAADLLPQQEPPVPLRPLQDGEPRLMDPAD